MEPRTSSGTRHFNEMRVFVRPCVAVHHLFARTDKAQRERWPVLSWITFSGTPAWYISVAPVARRLWFVFCPLTLIFLAKPSSSTSLKKLHRELLGAFSFSLVAQRRCAATDFSLLRFLSDNDSRFFFGTGVSSSPTLSVRPSSRPKGNRFRLLLSLSQLLPLVLAFSDIARSSRCW